MSDPLGIALRAAAASGATACDAMLVSSDALEAEVRGGEVDRTVRSRTHTLGVRLFLGQRVASGSTSDLSVEAIRGVVERAHALAEAAAEDPYAGLPDEMAGDAPNLDLYCAATAALEPDTAIELASRADAAARDFDPRIQPSGEARCSVHSATHAYARSDGFRGEYATSACALSVMPVAEASGEKQRDYTVRVARAASDLPDPEALGCEAARRATARLGAEKIESQRAAVIYEPRVATSLLRHLASAAAGDAVAEKRSFLAGKVGTSVTAPAVHVIDDAQLPRGLGSRPFDGEGVATRRIDLVRDGELTTYLLDAYNARRLGLPASTGSAGRSARGLPTPGSSNLWLERGESSPDSIISSTERGLLVTELIGSGVNEVTGDYSRGAAGLWIEDGEIRKPVHEVTVAGNLIELLGAIDAVGSDLVFFGALGAPTVRVAEAAIAGF